MASRAMKIDPKKPITTDLKAGQEVEETPNEAAIAARAYELWQERGCPIGSPETDWLRAEEELRSKPSVRPARQSAV